MSLAYERTCNGPSGDLLILRLLYSVTSYFYSCLWIVPHYGLLSDHETKVMFLSMDTIASL